MIGSTHPLCLHLWVISADEKSTQGVELGLVWEAVYHSKPVFSNRQFGRGVARSMGVADEAENPEGIQQVHNEDLIHLL